MRKITAARRVLSALTALLFCAGGALAEDVAETPAPDTNDTASSSGCTTHTYTCSYLDQTYHVYTCSVCGYKVKEKHDVTEHGTCIDCNATGLPVTASGSSSSGTSGSSSSGSTARTSSTASAAAETVNFWTVEDEVTPVTLGVIDCVVSDGSAEYSITTDQLQFDTTASDEQRFAIAYAPKTGKVSLRKTSSGTSKILKKIPSGTVLAVLEVDDKLAKVWYNGTVGYVSTGAIQFTGARTAIGTGVINYKGKTNGKKKINIRTKQDKSSAKVATLKTGTTVKVLEIGDVWSLVALDGWVGYVQNSYLDTTLYEPAATAAPEPTATPTVAPTAAPTVEPTAASAADDAADDADGTEDGAVDTDSVPDDTDWDTEWDSGEANG